MTNFEKPLHEFTEEELWRKTDQWDPRFGALALHELQRRLQKKNTEEVSTLVKQIKVLTKLSDTNAKTADQAALSSARLAKYAIGIALVALLVQVIFSIHQERGCATTYASTSDPGFMHFEKCYITFDLGLLGKYPIGLPDYRLPVGA